MAHPRVGTGTWGGRRSSAAPPSDATAAGRGRGGPSEGWGRGSKLTSGAPGRLRGWVGDEQWHLVVAIRGFSWTPPPRVLRAGWKRGSPPRGGGVPCSLRKPWWRFALAVGQVRGRRVRRGLVLQTRTCARPWLSIGVPVRPPAAKDGEVGRSAHIRRCQTSCESLFGQSIPAHPKMKLCPWKA